MDTPDTPYPRVCQYEPGALRNGAKWDGPLPLGRPEYLGWLGCRWTGVGIDRFQGTAVRVDDDDALHRCVR